MKKFESPLRVFLKISRVGKNVLALNVSTSLSLCPLDCDCLSAQVLGHLLSDSVDARRLFNGSYLLFSHASCQPLTVESLPSRFGKYEFDISLELEDGLVHEVHVCLEQSCDARRDYIVGDSRSLILVGVVSLSVDSDDDSQD